MSERIQLNLTPQEAALRVAQLTEGERLVKRSVDARRRGDIRVLLTIESFDSGQDSLCGNLAGFEPRDVSAAEGVVVVGSGPAGLFAALGLIERGLRPILLERGKNVRERKKDLAAINRGGLIDGDSNYSFGEGGAGTFSDGKLYTRSKKRGDNSKILRVLHQFGASESVLYEAHPHIGTDKLPLVIENIRKAIESCGGEVRFGTKVTGILRSGGQVRGVELADGGGVECRAVVLATGHSARDVYEFLNSGGVELEAKNFAVGVRVEHPQSEIDMIQYKQPRGEYLPAAAYSLVSQVEGRGVYSFCMCPGGFIVPAGTAAGECVVNGMSPSGRNNIYANSGIVTEVRANDLADYTKHFGVMSGLEFQRQLEQMAYSQAGASLTGATGCNKAPGQLLEDFVRGRSSRELIPTSYHPGVVPSDLHHWLPRFVGGALRGGFAQFNNKMRGFVSNRAMIIGVESRTSSPLRIPRCTETLMHPSVDGLFPCGEGAGYAGGILSSAVDGLRCADGVVEWLR